MKRIVTLLIGLLETWWPVVLIIIVWLAILWATKMPNDDLDRAKKWLDENVPKHQDKLDDAEWFKGFNDDSDRLIK